MGLGLIWLNIISVNITHNMLQNTHEPYSVYFTHFQLLHSASVLGSYTTLVEFVFKQYND